MKQIVHKGFTYAALTLGIGLASFSASAAFQEGRDYRVIDNPEQIRSDRIIVREFFWYGCPHCYSLHGHTQRWSQNLPTDVIFLKSPAALNPQWEVNARAFYVSQLMGYQSRTHGPLFRAIHVDGKRLFDQNSLSRWYGSQGINTAEFNNMYNSFAVSTRIGRSKAGARRYGLTGVPAVVVHGRYVVQGNDARVTEVVDYLVNKTRNDLRTRG